jgi:hypothetical protein
VSTGAQTPASLKLALAFVLRIHPPLSAFCKHLTVAALRSATSAMLPQACDVLPAQAAIPHVQRVRHEAPDKLEDLPAQPPQD